MEGMYRYIFDLILVSIPSSLIRAWGWGWRGMMDF